MIAVVLAVLLWLLVPIALMWWLDVVESRDEAARDAREADIQMALDVAAACRDWQKWADELRESA